VNLRRGGTSFERGGGNLQRTNADAFKRATADSGSVVDPLPGAEPQAALGSRISAVSTLRSAPNTKLAWFMAASAA